MNIYMLLLEGNGHKTKRFACLIYYHPVEVKAHGLIQFQVGVHEVATDLAAAKQFVKTAVAILHGPARPVHPYGDSANGTAQSSSGKRSHDSTSKSQWARWTGNLKCSGM